MNIFFLPTKFFFSLLLSLFGQVVYLFRQALRYGLLFASYYVRKSQGILLNLGDQSAPLRQRCFR